MWINKDRIVIGSLILFVVLFLSVTRTLNSGYHFVDDHEVIRMKNDLKTSTFSEVSKNWVKEDLQTNGRFRPFYYVHRVAEAKILSSDFFLWSLYTSLLYCFTLICFYSGARKLRFSIAESIVVLVVTFVGSQSAVWWRLGPGESLGMFLLSLSFYFMAASLNGKNFNIKNLFFVFFLIIASLTKESFLLIIPAMIVFKIWNDKVILWKSLRESVMKNLILAIPAGVLAYELYYIKFHVGISYSGLDTRLIANVLAAIITALHFFTTYINLVIAGIILLSVGIYYTRKLPVKFSLEVIVFFILVIAPNIILYSKSGMVERYLLPSTFALGILIASFIRGIEKDKDWFRKTAIVLIFISFVPSLAFSVREASRFTKEGLYTKALFSAIASNHAKGEPVLVIADPELHYEKSVSLKTYLLYEENIDLYGYLFAKENADGEYQGFVDGWKSYFAGKQYENINSKPGLLIFLDSNMVDEFFAKSNLSRTEFSPVDLGKSKFALFKSL